MIHPKNKLFPAAMGIALMSLSVACGSSSGGEAAVAPAPAPPAVEVFALGRGKLSSTFFTPAELVAYQQVDIYAKVTSFVKKLYVDIGSSVKTGQLLATMEAPELNAQLESASSRIKQQEAGYIASKSNYERLYETSQTPGTVSQNDLDQANARMAADKAQMDAAKSAFREVSDTKNYLEIRAPFSGIISARNVNPGAYVGPTGKGSELPMFTLQEQQQLRLVVSVPELYTGYLNTRTAIHFTVAAIPNREFTAIVKRMAGALDSKLRSERIEMDVVNTDRKLLPGMAAEVQIPMPATDSTFVIPRSALVNSTTGIFVVQVKDSVAHRVPAKPGRESGDMVEIYAALEPGALLVRTASDELHENNPMPHIQVKPVSDTTAKK